MFEASAIYKSDKAAINWSLQSLIETEKSFVIYQYAVLTNCLTVVWIQNIL